MNFPLDLAKDFLELQRKYDDAFSEIFTKSIELKKILVDDGAIPDNTNFFYPPETLINEAVPSKLGKEAAEYRKILKHKLDTRDKIASLMSDHDFMSWINSNEYLKRAINKHHKKMLSRKQYYLADQYRTHCLVRNILPILILYFEREINTRRIETYVLTKKKRERILDISNKLLTEIQGLPAIVNEMTQEQFLVYLQRFINELSSAETAGLAASKLHPKANREIFIKEIITLYYSVYDIIPADVITEIASIVDPDITERKVYIIINSARPVLHHPAFDEYYQDDKDV